MSPVARSPRLPPRSPPPSPASRLLALAAEVERLGNGARNGPEAFVLTKLNVARELRRLAQEVDR